MSLSVVVGILTGIIEELFCCLLLSHNFDGERRKLPKVECSHFSKTKTQCVELKLRWPFCVHTGTCPEIYF